MLQPDFLLIGAGYLVIALFILITILITIIRGVKVCKNNFSNALLIIAEIIFTIIGPIIGFMRFDEYGTDIPFSKPHVLSVILLVICSSSSFWMARFTKNNHTPLIRIFISVGLLQGIILCLITSIHFIPYLTLGVLYPTLGFELLSPIFALFILFREFYFYNKTELTLEQLLPNRKELGFVPLPFLIFHKPFFIKLLVYFALLIPLIASQVMLAYCYGQEVDAIIKAFTHSHGFTFSVSH